MEKRVVEGTDRASTRKRAAGAPKAAIITVEECPGLISEAQKYWPFFREMFKKLPVVAESDLASLQRMVETYAEIREYQATLKKEGKFYQSYTKQGDLIHKAHPALSALSDADRRFRAYMTDFGMTPASRTRVKGEDSDINQDPLSAFGI